MSASVSDTYGSAHDPLCFVNNLCVECHCDLIAKVREDERCKAELHDYHMPAWTAGFAKGYAAALDAAEAAVETWISYTFPAHRPGWTGNITAAIRSLKEKP